MLLFPISLFLGLFLASTSIFLFLWAPTDLLRTSIIVYGIVVLYASVYNNHINENVSYIIYLPFITGPYLQLHHPIRRIVLIDMQTRCVYLSLPKYTTSIHFSFLVQPWENPDNEYCLAIL
jgi:hypothetical protein